MKSFLADSTEKIIGILLALLPPVFMTMFGNSVRYIRYHRHEKFSCSEYLFGMISAAFMGLLVHAIGISSGMSVSMQSAIAGMCGYAGARLLDDAAAWFCLAIKNVMQKHYIDTKEVKKVEHFGCDTCDYKCNRPCDTKPEREGEAASGTPKIGRGGEHSPSEHSRENAGE